MVLNVRGELGSAGFVVSFVAFLLLACGGTAKESGVSSQSSPGSSAGSSGFDAGISPGTATIVFTVAGTDSYCATENDCGYGSPSIGIDGLNTEGSSCTSLDCDTCRAFGCLEIACQNETGVAVTGGQLEWDGIYDTQSTCGTGTACVLATYAKPGKYTATMCATPGTLIASDAGPVQCMPTGPAKCGHVEFDFPSSVVAMGTIGL
jgi:hypothetical protein